MLKYINTMGYMKWIRLYLIKNFTLCILHYSSLRHIAVSIYDLLFAHQYCDMDCDFSALSLLCLEMA